MKAPNLVLSGFMASGKTTVGRTLGVILGREFVDTDSVIEEQEGLGISDIFITKGEERFRVLERKAVRRVARRDGLIIAVGGGAVLDRRNLKRLKKSGLIYHLEVTAEEALARAGGGGERPLLGGGAREVEELLEARRDAYMSAADRIVETTGRRPESIAREIATDFKYRTSALEG